MSDAATTATLGKVTSDTDTCVGDVIVVTLTETFPDPARRYRPVIMRGVRRVDFIGSVFPDILLASCNWCGIFA